MALLLFSRLTGLLFTLPVASSRSVPLWVRIGLALALTVMLSGYLPAGHLAMGQLAVDATFELIVGLAIGFVAYLVVATAQSAGVAMESEVGLNIAAMVDPLLGMQGAMLTSFFTLTALTLFAVTGGLRVAVVTVVLSLHVVPLAHGFSAIAGGSMIGLTGRVLADGLLLAFPVLAVALLLNLVLGVLGRVLPQLNVLSFALGLGPLVAVATLVVGLGAAVAFMSMLFQAWSHEALLLLQGGL